MAESLASETDLSANRSDSARDFFLTLINANDKRYSESFVKAAQEGAWEREAVRELIDAVDDKGEQRQEASRVLIDGIDRRVEQRFVALEHVKRVELADQESRLSVLHEADKEYLATRLEALQRESALAINGVKESIALALSSAKEAVNKAEIANEKRFDGVNEFRATLADQQRLLIPRQEVDVIIKGLEGKLTIANTQIADLSTRFIALSSGSTGQAAGTKEGWGWAVGIVGLVLAVLSVVGMFVRMNPAATAPAPVYQVAAPAAPVYQISPPTTVQPK